MASKEIYRISINGHNRLPMGSLIIDNLQAVSIGVVFYCSSPIEIAYRLSIKRLPIDNLL
jgi:hypothetical protein